MKKDFPENSSIILGLPATYGRAVCAMRIYQTKFKKKKKKDSHPSQDAQGQHEILLLHCPVGQVINTFLWACLCACLYVLYVCEVILRNTVHLP